MTARAGASLPLRSTALPRSLRVSPSPLAASPVTRKASQPAPDPPSPVLAPRMHHPLLSHHRHAPITESCSGRLTPRGKGPKPSVPRNTGSPSAQRKQGPTPTIEGGKLGRSDDEQRTVDCLFFPRHSRARGVHSSESGEYLSSRFLPQRRGVGQGSSERAGGDRAPAWTAGGDEGRVLRSLLAPRSCYPHRLAPHRGGSDGEGDDAKPRAKYEKIRAMTGESLL